MVITTTHGIENTIIGLFLLFFGLFLAYKASWHTIVEASKCCSSGYPVVFRWESRDPNLPPHKAYFFFRDQYYANEFAQLNGLKVERSEEKDRVSLNSVPRSVSGEKREKDYRDTFAYKAGKICYKMTKKK
jgi:hypothetical protein